MQTENWQRCFKPGHLFSVAVLSITLMLGSLVSMTSAWAGTAAYVYDSLGRVKQVTYTDGAKITTITYSYDASGNRTVVVTSKNY
ncbi:RHS repeat protein [Pseudomonas sp. CAN2814]|uniref:RHS repeat domain-containing protein n=1 Tax=Pseudomonas sp. CAN1 TaxID=3046726 RepID=UPI002648FE36|nr:RHS repeat domain-containing protein [Pseudomonas sp. CAN1]MDN6860457.1 RHS repeat protein [Pseudomonas sp. CAN1]